MIAVTGANGLLGSYIVKSLAESNQQVVAIMRKGVDPQLFLEYGEKVLRREADVLDLPDLTAALENVEILIHTAATVSFNPRKAKKIIEVNVGGTRNVVDVCLQLGIPKLIHISSIAALSRQKDGAAIDETSKWIESDFNSDYAVSKYLAELEIFRGKEEGLQVSMVNPSLILAPTDWNKSSAQLFKYVWSEKLFYTEGTLNYVDVRDVVNIVEILVKGNYGGDKFIANAGSISILDFCKAIAIRWNKRAPSIPVGNSWLGVFGWLEEFRSFLTGSEPLITRQSAKLAGEKFLYNNEKVQRVLGIKFHSMEESLDWCCEEYLRKINTNK